jgi:hypothetical protein
MAADRAILGLLIGSAKPLVRKSLTEVAWPRF